VRFAVRLVIVEGAGGFGKTTVLAQAVSENADAPQGVDVWLGCEPADGNGDHLARALAQALGDDRDLHDVDALAELVWQRAPTPVALILDDAHLVTDGSSGHTLLESLMRALPANGHLVLAGRAPLPVRYSRLLAQGDAVVIGEDDLRLTPSELADVAIEHGLPEHALDASGGWPALAALGAAAGPDAARRFVLEEVYRGLPSETRHALAVLCLLDGGDDELVSAAVGEAVDLERALASVPLVARHDAGWYRPHALWRPIVEGELADADAGEARRRAAMVFDARGDLAAAAELLLGEVYDDDTWAVMRGLISEGCQLGSWVARGELVASWWSRLPSDRRDEPEGLLLAATAARLREGDSVGVAEQLERARAAAFESGNVSAEVAALSQLGHLAWWRDDLASGAVICARASELSSAGWSIADPVARFGDAMLADIAGDPATMLRAASGIDRDALSDLLAGAADWLQARALNQLGRSEEAIPYAERACSRAGFAAAQTSRVIAYFQAGRLNDALRCAAALDPTLMASARDRLLTSVVLAAGTARLGLLARARKTEAIATADAPAVTGPRAAALLQLARAVILVAEGDEDAAAVLTEDAVRDATPSTLFALQGFLPLVYVLAPWTRDVWDAMELGPDHHATRAAARAFVTVREEQSALPREGSAELVIAALGVQWAVELAAATGDLELAECCLRYAAAPARRRLHDLVERGGPIGAGASQILKRVPVPPSQPVELRLLGPTTLVREGVEVADADWRRERVRTLLAFLVVKGHVTRGDAASTLWPDLDPETAAGNLRVTLRYLQRVLEPDRDPGTAAWFVRADGDALRLCTDMLVVDVWEMERHLDGAAAADADGRPGDALRELECALDVWHGDFLADSFDDWALLEQDRIRARFLAGAVRAGELLLARGRAERALELGTRAVDAEPWSEAAYRLVASAHLAAGDTASARRALTRCRAMLADLGVDPEPTTAMLDRRVNPASPAG
jgi:DNA-binding SARP family transcriptional activator/ATP/maltotriose-dependent transcriptional regulator MalT